MTLYTTIRRALEADDREAIHEASIALYRFGDALARISRWPKLLRTVQHVLVFLVALLFVGCGDPPPLSGADAGPEQCIDEGGTYLVPCPDEPLCWSRRHERPKVCSTDEEPVDLGMIVTRDAGEIETMDAGEIEMMDAGTPNSDAFEPEPDAFVPPTLDPRLEVWPAASEYTLGSCSPVGEMLPTGGDYCAFEEGNIEDGIVLKGAPTGTYGFVAGEPCVPNADIPGNTSRGQCRVGRVCFDGTCRQITALESDWCPTGYEVLDVGHETRGVCIPEAS